MSGGRVSRYCRCGTRLAVDHAGERCAPCEQKLIDRRAAPPDVPVDFWHSDQFRNAFATHHMGQVSRAYRKHPSHAAAYGNNGIPQEVLGEWLGLTQAQISRIENGPPIRNLDTLLHWARTLRIPAHLLWFTLPGPPEHLGHRAQQVREVAVPWPKHLPAGGITPPSSGVRYDARADSSAMQAFRAADRQHGGGHLYGSVVHYLHAEVGPRLFAGEDDGAGNDVFTAAAALTEMAAWMAHDAGRDLQAQRHFGRALDFVKVGGDHQLGAHILASMSHLAHHRDKPVDAICLARRGRETLTAGDSDSGLEARLLAMEARGCAALGQSTDCVQLLLQAEKTLDRPPVAPPSPWISHFDEGAFASEAARCMLQLGDLAGARRQAERIIALRASDRTRSRAFGQLLLVKVLLSHGKPGEACALAQEVLQATHSLSSFLVVQQLLRLQEPLKRYRTKAATEFLESLRQALGERLSLYPWITNGSTGTGETRRDSDL